MELHLLFDVSPFLALSFCVCLGTVAWCIILLRRGCHHVADRYLIGFIGLLAVYQSLQILRRGGVIAVPHLRHFDEAVDLLVNSLYLLAALILRISNHDRFETIFRLRLAEALPATYVPDPIQRPDPRILEQLRSAASMLSGDALKLYVHICFHADRQTGLLEAGEEELLQFLAMDRKALLSAMKELREKGLCGLEPEEMNRPVRMIMNAPKPNNVDIERLSAPS
jgi:hypothetical protein